MSKPILIIIAGGTSSGKSTFAKKIKEHFKDKRVVNLCAENYIKRSDIHLMLESSFSDHLKHHSEFNNPQRMKHNDLLSNLKDLLDRKEVKVKVRKKGLDGISSWDKEKKEPGEIIVLEGVNALQDEKVRNMADLKIFIEADENVRLVRKILRSPWCREAIGEEVGEDLRNYGKSLVEALKLWESDKYGTNPSEKEHVINTKDCAQLVINSNNWAECEKSITKVFICIDLLLDRDEEGFKNKLSDLTRLEKEDKTLQELSETITRLKKPTKVKEIAKDEEIKELNNLKNLLNRIQLTIKYERIVVIGLDGVGLFFKETETPTIDNFFASGASSLKVKAVVPTDSAQNWGSIIHGVLPEKHGLKNGNIEKGIEYDENSPYPSIFKIISQKEKNIKMTSYVSWEPINTGIVEKSVEMEKYAPLTHENIFWRWWLRFKHRWLKSAVYDYTTVSRLVDYIRDPRNNDTKVLFIHLTDVDEYGHDHGYESEPYLNQIRVMDSQVDEILRAIDKAGWRNDSLIIMTTDHGGVGKGHGGDSAEEVDVFLAVRGKGIEPDSKIKENITNMDCAAIILKGLGIEIPENFDAKIPLSLIDQHYQSGIEISPK